MKDIALLLHETAGLVRRRFERAARPEGLTLMQWRVLGLLHRDGPLRQGTVVEMVEASPMTISDLADRLEGAGLVRRAADPGDSRAKTLELTEAGAAKLEDMRVSSTKVFEEVFDGLSEEDCAQLRQTLLRIKNNLGGA